jgi:hypothetical protein
MNCTVPVPVPKKKKGFCFDADSKINKIWISVSFRLKKKTKISVSVYFRFLKNEKLVKKKGQRVCFVSPNIGTNLVDTSCGTAWRRIWTEYI